MYSNIPRTPYEAAVASIGYVTDIDGMPTLTEQLRNTPPTVVPQKSAFSPIAHSAFTQRTAHIYVHDQRHYLLTRKRLVTLPLFVKSLANVLIAHAQLTSVRIKFWDWHREA